MEYLRDSPRRPGPGARSRPASARRTPARGRRWDHSTIQSLLFDRSIWSSRTAVAWARRHGYAAGKVHVTDRYVRLRQHPPGRGEKKTIGLGRDTGIRAVVEEDLGA